MSIVDEIPFDIPDSWEWVRLSTIIELQSGQDLTSDKYNSTGRGIPYITGASNIENNAIIINRWTEDGRAFAYRGDLLLTCKGTVGKMAFLKEEQVHLARQIMSIRPVNGVEPQYLRLVLESSINTLKKVAKSMIPGISRNDVLSTLMPVPPLQEQHRIISKYFDVSPFILKYDEIETALSELNSDFPNSLKKSILQWAIQGKLVPQDQNDESAAVLLERISAEKNRLTKEGKIKKDKNESIIFRRDNSHYENLNGIERCIDDEIPFEIPDSWCWARIGTIFTLQAGKNIHASEIQETFHSGLYPCYGGNGIRGFVNKLNHIGDYPIIGRQGALCGNINRATGEFYATEHAICVDTFCNTDVTWTCFFLEALNLNQYATATAQPGLAVANINTVLIPIPPWEEQYRIKNRIEELLPIIKTL